MLLRIALVISLLCGAYLARAQSPSQLPVILGGALGSCGQSSSFLARTSGQDNSHKAAYDALICGLAKQASTISGTLFSRLDGLYMLRGADSTVILLNLIKNAFNLTSNGTITFAANAGVTSNGTTGYYSTGFNPSTAGGQFAQNSALLATCITATNAGIALGTYDGVNAVHIFGSSPNTSTILNNLTDARVADLTAALWLGSRTASTTLDIYKNALGSQGSDATASVGVPNGNIFVLARNDSATPTNFLTPQATMAAIGGGYSATDVSNFRALISSYMAAIGAAAC